MHKKGLIPGHRILKIRICFGFSEESQCPRMSVVCGDCKGVSMN